MDAPPTGDCFPSRDSDEPTDEWVGRLCEDMQARWRAGQPARMADYLRTFPELAADREAALDLIAQERLLRVELGESPTSQEYVALYPAWEAEIRALFAVEDGLVDLAQVASEPSPSPDQQAGPNAPAGDAPPAVPTRFQFIRWLGRGGFGRVGLYRDTRYQRPVALKFIHPEHAADRARLDRFRREAEVAAGLNHPHVCTLFEFDLDHDPPYLVFEYVDGETLRHALGQGSLPVTEAVRIARDVADGMAHCHTRGSVHRDLKPDNVKRRTDGWVKVLDLGLARPLDPTAPPITSLDTVPGTVAYCSPEQLQTSPNVGPATDQFSLGVTLYELLTGRRPFEGQTLIEIARRITDRPPTPLREYRASLDDAIVSIVLRLLEKNPANRFASMGEVRQVLDAYLAGNRKPVQRPRQWVYRAAPWLGGGLLVAVLAWLAFEPTKTATYRSKQEPPPQPPVQPQPNPVVPAPDLAALLGRIATDLAARDDHAQPYLRYFSLAHLANDPRVSLGHRQQARDALATLLPKLSATGDPVALELVAGDPTLLRVDLRQLGWIPERGGQWEDVIRHYPFSLRYNIRDFDPTVRSAGATIEKLLRSDRVELDPDITPVVLADWFVAAASDEPLADKLLRSTVVGDAAVQARREAIRTNPLLTLAREDYLKAPVDLTRAAAELGLADPERLKALLLARDDLTARNELTPWLHGGSVARAHWLRAELGFAPYGDLAAALMLGVHRRVP